MRIALFTLNYAPEVIGIGRYSTDMAEELARRGHAVEVICGKPYYPQWSVYPAFRGKGWRRARENGVGITRVPHYVPAQPTGLRRILHLASFAIDAMPPAIGLTLRRRARHPQAVICVAPGILSAVPAWLAARIVGAPLWLHIQDFEIEAAFATGLVDGGGAIARLARWVERRLLALADVVSSISPQMCARLAEKGVPAPRIIEIRNWADSRLANRRGGEPGASPYRAEWQLGTGHVALYSGNIANKQGIEILIAGARLLAHRADIVIVICGQGPNRARLEALAAGCGNVRFFDLQPSARMGELLALASVHLLPQIPEAADLVLPSKLTNMLASGRPVVATASPGTGLYDEVAGCGIATPPGDAAALAAAVAALIDDPERARRLGACGKLRAVERWSLASNIDRLEQALDRSVRQ